MNAGDAEELVGIAHTGDRAEAEMIQGLLESAGIPSALQPVGLDGPLVGIGVLNPGGPRRVMVRANQAEQARALIAETLAKSEQVDLAEFAETSFLEETGRRKPRGYGLIGAYARIWAWSLGTMGLAFAVFLLTRSL